MTQLDILNIRSVANGDPDAKVLVTKRFLRAVAEALDAPAVLDVPPDPFAVPSYQAEVERGYTTVNLAKRTLAEGQG